MTSTLTIIADDLTGGCDTGTLFAGRGPVPLALWPHTIPCSHIRVIDTESRALDRRDAADRVRAAAAAAPASLLFKKIDSTLRGRIGVETEALMDAAGISRALLCPAFPAQGRAVVDRVLRVEGIPVSATPIGQDPQFPPCAGATRLAFPDVTELLRSQFERPLAWLSLAVVRSGAERLRDRLQSLTGCIVVADAENDGDLGALVGAALADSSSTLMVGSAGLAHPLARHLGMLAGRVALPRTRRWLVVAGSRHPATRRQIAAARAAGMTVIATPEGNHAGAVESVAEEARRVIEGGGADLVVATGGDTAVALLETLRAERMDLIGAPRAGLALGHLRAPGRPRLNVLTKAGGFGGEDLFVSLFREALAPESTLAQESTR